MSKHRSRRSGEKGTILPLVALGLVVLMGFAAIAVDAGNGYAERRRSQSAADSSVLAAAVEALGTGFSPQDLLDEALAFAEKNLPDPPTEEDWRICDDPSPLANTSQTMDLTLDNHFGTINGFETECFSISGGGDTLRVWLPDRNVKTHFATVIGVDNLRVHAFAEASLSLPGVAKAPPFVVPDGTSGGEERCLRTGPAPSEPVQAWDGMGPGVAAVAGSLLPPGTTAPDPCDESFYSTASEFFGTLRPVYYTDILPGVGADTTCGSTNSTLDFQISAGIDHLLGTFDPDYTPGAPERIEGDDCNASATPLFPDTMFLDPGLSAQDLYRGLLGPPGGGPRTPSSPDGLDDEGRLRKSPFFQTTYQFAAEDMDNTPLWDYIRDDADTLTSADIPQACIDVRTAWEGQSFVYNDAAWDYYDFKEETLLCIQNWVPGLEHIFSETIVDNGRFGFIPYISEADLLAAPVHFNEFVPVYITKLYQLGQQTTFSSPECWEKDPTAPPGQPGWHTHEAGQPFDCGRNNQNVDRVASIVLKCGALPEDICIDLNPGTPGGAPVLIIELTK